MPTILVAIYHTIADTAAIRRALAEAGVAHGDVHVSDYVDPVVRNAPASTERESGLFYLLSGVPRVDVEAYKEGIARGRTIVAVRTTEAQADRVASVLERFEPIDLGEPGEISEGERALAEETGALPRGAAGGTGTTETRSRLRRYTVPDSDGSGR